MPNLDPQELANTILDQAHGLREMGDAIRDRDQTIAQLRDGWNRIELVKERYDELKRAADANEAREVAAAMTAEKQVATIPTPINPPPISVQSAKRGPSAGKRVERGGR